MKKILLFSFFLMLGLVVSQFLPAMVGEGYSSVKMVSNTLLYVCLAFIMINVGREFEMDKAVGGPIPKIILLQWRRLLSPGSSWLYIICSCCFPIFTGTVEKLGKKTFC